MKATAFLEDTIARRFALTILSVILATVGLNALFVSVGAIWAQPSARELGLYERAGDIFRVIEAAPQSERADLAAAVGERQFKVRWYAADSPAAHRLNEASIGSHLDSDVSDELGSGRRYVLLSAENDGPKLAALTSVLTIEGRGAIMGASLNEGSWLVFEAPRRFWGIGDAAKIAVRLAFVTFWTLVVTAIATHRMIQPVHRFTNSLRRFGLDPRASRVPEVGPLEFRDAISAFNAMQTQVQSLLESRTLVFAAISHDLRTPLTKIRLRGELIDDQVQRARLFQDVSDMQAMLDSALGFLRDGFEGETPTSFDLPALFQTIVDDYTDKGVQIDYSAPPRTGMVGRPFTLKRAFSNLVDNAVKYGERPQIEMRNEANEVSIYIRDTGPGVPAAVIDQLFKPFFRVETSRNRRTGGVGLGLTSAKAIIEGHGGTITIGNRSSGGLEVRCGLPIHVDHPIKSLGPE